MRGRIERLLNDGRLTYGEVKTQRDENGKKLGVVFTPLGYLFYNYQTINANFDEYIVGHVENVDLKLKTYYTKELKTEHLIEIEGERYEITTIDPEPRRRYMFLFLRKQVD